MSDDKFERVLAELVIAAQMMGMATDQATLRERKAKVDELANRVIGLYHEFGASVRDANETQAE